MYVPLQKSAKSIIEKKANVKEVEMLLWWLPQAKRVRTQGFSIDCPSFVDIDNNIIIS